MIESNTKTKKAVILARGLGKRMRASAEGAELSSEQERIAAAGIKALMPLANGMTMLDMIARSLAAAGLSELCLVIGPEHDAIRRYCAENGIEATFAVQAEAKGTADAVLAAEPWIADGEMFLLINSDNLYPVNGLRHLSEAARSAVLGFERTGLIEKSNISADRIVKFASAEIDQNGLLKRLTEKPKSFSADALVSMNAWSFSPSIFQACRAIEPSERGELEITSAVQYAIDVLGEEFLVIRSVEGVLDLSSRMDVGSMAGALKLGV